MSLAYWQKFFGTAGIPPADAENYAIIFEDNRITESMLGDLRKEHLSDMGIRRMGDIIGILKCASTWSSTTSQQSRLQQLQEEQQKQQKQTQSQPQLMPVPTALQQQQQQQPQLDQPKVSTNITNSSTNVAPLGRVVATGDGARRFTVAPEVEQTAPKRKIDDRFKAAVTAAAVGAASVRLQEASSESGRPVFSRLGELSSLSNRAAAAASPAASKSSNSNSTASGSVFNRLGGSRPSPAAPSISGRTVVAALNQPHPSSAAAAIESTVASQKVPTIIRPIRFDLVDDGVDDGDDDEIDKDDNGGGDGSGPSPAKMPMKVVDKWPSHSRGDDSRHSRSQHHQHHQHQASRTHRSREGSSGPLSYRGVLKLPTSTTSESAPAGVKKVEAHSTVEELGPTLYSDSISYSSRHHRDRDRDSRDARRRRSNETSATVRRRSEGERIIDTIRRESEGGGGSGSGGQSSASASGKFARIVINKSVR